MRVIRSIRGLQTWRRQEENQGAPIGFVPTMGALHEGHLSLIHRAGQRCSIVVVSIFVNPLQFGPEEDLAHYPRTIKRDTRLCREAGVDVIFIPSKAVLYPSSFQTSVQVHDLSQRWEGEARPTHFEGVTTVVTKLLCLVRPDYAYFGQKDFQQLVVVQKLVQDLNILTKIVRCPTIRESDGLALSSRNRYLSGQQRKQATCLSAALRYGKQAIQDGEHRVSTIQKNMRKILRSVKGIHMEYLVICHATSLEPVKIAKGNLVLLGAIRLGDVRLIDNMLVKSPKKS